MASCTIDIYTSIFGRLVFANSYVHRLSLKLELILLSNLPCSFFYSLSDSNGCWCSYLRPYGSRVTPCQLMHWYLLWKCLLFHLSSHLCRHFSSYLIWPYYLSMIYSYLLFSCHHYHHHQSISHNSHISRPHLHRHLNWKYWSLNLSIKDSYDSFY